MKSRTPAGEAAREWLNREVPFTRPQDALDEAMTREDAMVIAGFRSDIDTADDMAELNRIASVVREYPPLIRAALRDPWRRRRNELNKEAADAK